MSINLQTLTSAVYAQLYSASAGSAVRAALGASAASVIPAADLDSAASPARPFVVLRGGAVAGESKELRIPTFTWWLYDDAARRHWRINGLIPLIEAAYPFFCITGGRIEIAGIGQETTDDALQLPVRTVQLAFYTRG